MQRARRSVFEDAKAHTRMFQPCMRISGADTGQAVY